MRTATWFLAPALVMAAIVSCSESAPARTEDPLQGPLQGPSYTVVDTFDHDTEAWTEGLTFWRGRFFESTGDDDNGVSTLREVDLETGEVLRSVAIAQDRYGEGMTILDKRVYQLTWQDKKAFVYRPKRFRRTRTYSYEGEGWGLTHNGRRLIMSNGTNVIAFRDPRTFEILREIEVTENGLPVDEVNELEWIKDEIFANIWETDDIIRIDPATGDVLQRINLSMLHADEDAEGAPSWPNGIAYLRSEDRLFVTGKLWAHVYEIELTE